MPLTLILIAVAIFFGFIGAIIARTRGYSSTLGWGVGWTGLGAWLILALLPLNTAPQAAATSFTDAEASTGRFRRVESILQVIYPLVTGLYVAFFAVAGLSAVMPELAVWLTNAPAADVLLGVPSAATALLLATIWILSIYLLNKDTRLPSRSRGAWTIALIFLNLLAGLVFVPWRWRVLRRQRERLA